jgi:F-type H+-transporting ATPase subunit epsilon
MPTMHVALVSIERPLWSGEATAVYARTPEGEIGVMAKHAPLIGVLSPGWSVRIQREGEDELRVAVHGGFISVTDQGVSVLAEMAEMAEEVDVARARDHLAQTQDSTDPDTMARRLRNMARLHAAGESV